MSLKPQTKRIVNIALTSPSAAKDLCDSIDANTVAGLAGSKPAATLPTVITYSASADTYVADTTLTIAAGATPTGVELLHYCVELQRQLTAIQSALTARGVTL